MANIIADKKESSNLETNNNEKESNNSENNNNEKYPYTLQNKHINLFLSAKDKVPYETETDNNVFDEKNKTAYIKKSDTAGNTLNIEITNYKKGDLSISVHRLFITLLALESDTSKQEKIIRIKDLIKFFDLNKTGNKENIKDFTKKIKKNLNSLRRTKLDFTYTPKKPEKNNKNNVKSFNAAICKYAHTKKGIVTFKFTDQFFEFLKTETYPMPLDRNFFKIDIKKYQHSFYIFYVTSVHINMNYDKKNSNYISVENLIDKIPILPNLQKVDGKINKRIIDPLNTNFDYLKETFGLKWERVNSIKKLMLENKEQEKEAKILTEKQINRVTTYDIKTQNIEFEFSNYPIRGKKQSRRVKKVQQPVQTVQPIQPVQEIDNQVVQKIFESANPVDVEIANLIKNKDTFFILDKSTMTGFSTSTLRTFLLQDKPIKNKSTIPKGDGIETSLKEFRFVS